MIRKSKKYLLPLLIILLTFSCSTAEQKREAGLHYKLGLARLRANQYQSAYVEFERALEYYDGDKDIYNALGYVYLRWDDPDNAKKAFTRAVDIDPDFSEGYNNLCLVEYQRKQYSEAVAYCKKALSNPLYPTPEKAFFNLGLAQFKLKKYNKAIDALTQATIRKSDYYPAFYELAVIYNQTGDYGDAAKSLEQAIKFDPRFKGNMEKAENFFQSGGDLPWCRQDASQILEVFKY